MAFLPLSIDSNEQDGVKVKKQREKLRMPL